MSSSCTPILVGVVFPVLEILVLSKTAKFPFRTMDYSPWSSKNLIDRNRLKKFMQVGIDVTCKYTNFIGRGLFGFGDTGTFKIGQCPWSSKNLIDRNRLKKFIHVGIDVTCKYTDFGECDLFGFGDMVLSKTAKFPFRTMDYSPWLSKNLIDRNRLKKFMQVVIDVTCKYTDFGGHGLFGFGDTSTLKNGQIFLSDHGL